jgi:ArsR family transcriptional regulator
MCAMNLTDFSELFKSLSEPVRLRILYLLLERGELCVCDIVNALGIPQSMASRHLAFLRHSGLVSTRREGVWIYYQLLENTAFISRLLEDFRVTGGQVLALQDDVERLAAEGDNNCC